MLRLKLCSDSDCVEAQALFRPRLCSDRLRLCSDPYYVQTQTPFRLRLFGGSGPVQAQTRHSPPCWAQTSILMLGSDIHSHARLRHLLSCWAQTSTLMLSSHIRVCAYLPFDPTVCLPTCPLDCVACQAAHLSICLSAQIICLTVRLMGWPTSRPGNWPTLRHPYSCWAQTSFLMLGSDTHSHAGLRHPYSCWAHTSILMLGPDKHSHAGLTLVGQHVWVRH